MRPSLTTAVVSRPTTVTPGASAPTAAAWPQGQSLIDRRVSPDAWTWTALVCAVEVACNSHFSTRRLSSRP